MNQPRSGALPAGFDAGWLILREPYDIAARALGAEQAQMQAHMAQWRAAVATDPVRVLDLACGLGANLRVLAPRLCGVQHWHLVDHDPALLAALPSALQRWTRQQGYAFAAGEAAAGCRIDGDDFCATVSWQRLDLARDLDRLDLAHTALISASALLDLVSAAWLQRLIEKARVAGAAMLWALSVDGVMGWEPADRDDITVHALFRQHQQRDKGFGPALGPQAAAIVPALLAQAGYRSTVAQTDWDIGSAHGASMQRTMIEGIAAAAREQAPSMQARVRAWHGRRLAGIDRSSLRVGHVDVLATLR